MKVLVLLTCMAITACNSTQSTTEQVQKVDQETQSQEAMATTTKSNSELESEGYIRGVVMAGKGEGSCEFVIDIKGGFAEQLVDPTNMDASFKSHNQKVWLKFRGLRMQNRCPEARPVEITEIFVRKE